MILGGGSKNVIPLPLGAASLLLATQHTYLKNPYFFWFLGNLGCLVHIGFYNGLWRGRQCVGVVTRSRALNYHCGVSFHHPTPLQLHNSARWSRHRSIVESWFAVFVIFNSSSSSTTSLWSRCAGVVCIATKDQIRKPRHQFASPCCLSRILSVFQKTGKQVDCSSIYLSIFLHPI